MYFGCLGFGFFGSLWKRLKKDVKLLLVYVFLKILFLFYIVDRLFFGWFFFCVVFNNVDNLVIF